MDTKKTIFTDCCVYRTDSESFRAASVVVRGDTVTDIIEESSPLPEGDIISLGGRYVIPGLVDVHSHGRGGYDFNTAAPELYSKIAASYAEVGTTSVMPTLASAPFDSLESSTKAIAEHKSRSGEAAFLGIHLEGRYLSPKKRGAHAAELLAPPSADELRRLKYLAKDTRMRLSMAPELDGAAEMIGTAIELGIPVTAAHTDADYAQLVSAVDNGIIGFTHTFNAMRPIHHRDPGGAGAALLCDTAYSEFICDGMHLAPEIILLSHRVKPHDKFVLITDSMEAAGCPDGEYFIAGLPVTVKNGLALNTEGALSGSTLDMFTALTNYMSFCSLSLESALPTATVNPARMIGADGFVGSVDIGRRADMIILNSTSSPRIHTIYAGGAEVI